MFFLFCFKLKEYIHDKCKIKTHVMVISLDLTLLLMMVCGIKLAKLDARFIQRLANVDQ